MPDLSASYLGLRLRSPLVASASPLTGKIETLRALEEAGAGAVVLRSLFEEQIERESLDFHEVLERWTDSYTEAQSFFPVIPRLQPGPSAYLELVESAKRELAIPVIASLNGISPTGWTRYARLIQEAGADAIELNIYLVAADANETAASVEDRYVQLVGIVRDAVTIPMAVKIAPFFTALPSFARRLVDAGADGLVLFNRFMQPDIDIEACSVVPSLRLSTQAELTLPLRWIAILRGMLSTSLAATSGIHDAQDALKALFAGADVAMLASALLIHGPEHLATILDELQSWLAEHEYDSLDQLKGSLSQVSVPDPSAFERAHYVKAIASFSGPLPAPRPS